MYGVHSSTFSPYPSLYYIDTILIVLLYVDIFAMWNSSESVSVRSASFRESGDDEEALQWAALERLPTYNRVRKGVFKNIVGDLIEIDVHKLELEERKVVLNRLVQSVDDDWDRFFLRIRQRFDK